MLEVGGFRKFVTLVHVDVVHQDVLVLTDELECAGTFHGILCLLLVVGLFNPSNTMSPSMHDFLSAGMNSGTGSPSRSVKSELAYA